MGVFAGDLLMSPRLVSSPIMFSQFRAPTSCPRRPTQSSGSCFSETLGGQGGCDVVVFTI